GKVRETKPGVYRVEYGLAMSGEWDVNVRVRPKGTAAVDAAYRLSTSTPGLAFSGGTPPAGGDGSQQGMSGMPGMPGMPSSRSGEPRAATPTEQTAGTVRIDPARRQEIGIRTAPAQVMELSTIVRAVGRVTYDEKRQAEVCLKFAGWVRDINVDYTGRPVVAGEVLFTAYSPELWSAQQEYLEALRTRSDSSAGEHGEGGSELAQAARRRL